MAISISPFVILVQIYFPIHTKESPSLGCDLLLILSISLVNTLKNHNLSTMG